MRLRNCILILLATLHVGLVVSGAAELSWFSGTSRAASLLQWYSHLSGTDNNYSFFAPGVGPQERVTFIMTDAEGQSWTDDLKWGRTHEVNLCFSTVPFVMSSVDDDTAYNMMRSMADTMFRRHPTARTVDVRVETYAIELNSGDAAPIYDFPTMQEYREGKRPQWTALYHLEFSRS